MQWAAIPCRHLAAELPLWLHHSHQSLPRTDGQNQVAVAQVQLQGIFLMPENCFPEHHPNAILPCSWLTP